MQGMLLVAVVVDPAGPGIGRDPDVGQGFGLPAGLGLLLGLASVALVVYARIRLRRTGKRIGLRKVRGGAAVGNAFMDLNSMLQPDRPAAVEILRMEEEDHEDEYGDGRSTQPPVPTLVSSPHRTEPESPRDVDHSS